MLNLFEVDNAQIMSYGSYSNGSIIVDVKRDDLLHPQVSGNKLRKLKYNIQHALQQGATTIVTYGGAFSNHIAATAAAGAIVGIRTIGIIRGEELAVNMDKTLAGNDTLRLAVSQGMQLHFVTRDAYRDKSQPEQLNYWRQQYPDAYFIPEGGTNKLAVKGSEEILTATDKTNYDIICVAAGTGGTAAGIINSATSTQRIIVFSALKGDFMKNEILKYTARTDFEVVNEIRFGGYAKSNKVLIDFMNARYRTSGIPLDPIYTAKMLYGIEQMIESAVITGKVRILAVHTGGLQTVAGYNKMLLKKGQKTIDYA